MNSIPNHFSDESSSLGSESPLYRILEIRDYLASVAEPVTRQQLAEHFGVSRHTIYRDLPKVQQLTLLSETPDGRIYINRQDYLASVRFTLHEAMSVYLAARLLATRMDRRNKHAASGLRKLAGAFERFAPELSRQMEDTAQAVDSEGQLQDPRYLAALETLTRALADRKKVRIGYKKDDAAEEKEFVLAPYFIEPYAIGQTTYVVGVLENTARLYTFKVERITRAELLAEPYSIPSDFNIVTYLNNAWGIWTSDQEPELVVLRFSKEVAFRVKETRWHHLQEVELEADGSLLWRARVANLVEMRPWIRSWGANVEVLEPQALREEMIQEARRIAQLYL